MDIRVTIGGSYRKHLEDILCARRVFAGDGAQVLRPASDQVIDDEGSIVRLAGDPSDAESVERAQLDAIRRSHLFYVVNPGGYVGSSAMLEVGFAAALGVPVVFSEKPFEAAASARARAIGSPRRALACVLRERLLPADLQLLEDVVDDPALAGTRGERAGGQILLRCDTPPLALISETTPVTTVATHSSEGWTLARPVDDRYIESCRLVLAALLERPGADWRRIA